MEAHSSKETKKSENDDPVGQQDRPKVPTKGLKAMLEQCNQERLNKSNETRASIVAVEQTSANTVTPERFCKVVSPLITEQVCSLPIYRYRDEFIELVKNNQVVVVKGETGSGKSTQIPKYLAAAGYTKDGKVMAITQPRRVSAKSLAERVSKETGTDMGDLVGYAVRFENCTSKDTIIKYVTDGLLIKEATSDPNLQKYSVVMIDEAHERCIHTDLCFGLLKRICKERPEFRAIISSATMEEEALSKYFNNAPIFNISGRAFPVEIVYEPQPIKGMYLDGVVKAVMKICQTESQGDILVFLAGTDDIDAVRANLTKRISSDAKVMIIDCHGTLPFEEQQRVFEKTPMGFRKIILATNIAETTLTIEGMDYVVDCGYFKQTHFDACAKIDVLGKDKITKFQTQQRAGRAGRTGPGKCYRLYSEQSMNNDFKSAPIPEIQRYNIQYVILDIIAMGFPDPLTFEYMTPPSPEIVSEGISFLKELSALDSITGHITQMGKIMGQFPVEPQLAKALVMSVEMGCREEVLRIAAMLCTQYMNIFQRQKLGSTIATDPRILQFTRGSDGDHLILLKIYREWDASGFSEEWCKNNLIEHRHLQEARDILVQLKDILIANKGFFDDFDGKRKRGQGRGTMKDNILKAFTTGYYRQVAQKCDSGYAYQILSKEKGVASQPVFLHPSSALFKRNPPPEWVIFHGILKTTKAYMRGTSEIQAQWLLDYAAPGFLSKFGINR